MPLAQEVFRDEIGGPAEGQQEGDYFKPKGEGQAALEIQAAAEFDVVEEQLRMEAALLHPKARTDYQETLAQLVLVTSQTPGRLKQQQKELWPDKVARWKAALKGKTVEKRLSELVAVEQAKGNKRRQATKEAKKMIIGKTSKKWAAVKNKNQVERNGERAQAERTGGRREPLACGQGSHVHCSRCQQVLAECAVQGDGCFRKDGQGGGSSYQHRHQKTVGNRRVRGLGSREEGTHA